MPSYIDVEVAKRIIPKEELDKIQEYFINTDDELTEDEQKHGKVIFRRKADNRSPFEFKW